MIKINTFFGTMFLTATLGMTCNISEAATFEIECTFDDSSMFADDVNLPSGWLNEGRQFVRQTSSYFGHPAKSGDWMLGLSDLSFNEVIYTPVLKLQGGKPCTIELSFYAPGGNPPTVRCNGLQVGYGTSQNLETHTVIETRPAQAYSEWTSMEFTFTPDSDGEYCFSLKPIAGPLASNCGLVAFDDIFISGTSVGDSGGELPPLPEFDPDPENSEFCIELPYRETFSDASHYTGDSYVPRGWASYGTQIFRTANVSALPAKSGEYYLITPNSESPRDESLYTCFFDMEAGTTYTMNFYTYIQGNNWNEDEIMYTPTLDVTVGTQQDADFHGTLMRVKDYANPSVGWDERTVSFTPEKSGPYCFSFRLSGEASTGAVAIDYVRVSAPGQVYRVEPAFLPEGRYDLMDSRMTLFGNDPVKMVNLSQFADEYSWEVPGAEPSTSTEESPAFIFPDEGIYTVRLTATNIRGSRTSEKDIMVKKAVNGQSYSVMLYNSSDDKMLDKGDIPAFDTDDTDFITGFNHHYMSVAQRYDFPDNVKNQINSLSFWITDRIWRGMTEYLDDQRIKPMSIKIYGAKSDGSLDDTKVFGSIDSTNGDLLGSAGLGTSHGEMRSIDFPEPVETKGTIYVSMEFHKSMTIDPEDVNFGRSYFSTGVVKFGSGRTTLYGLSSADGLWKRIDQFDPEMKGYGAYWHLWLSPKDGAGTSIAVNTVGEEVLAARFTPAGTLQISGLENGASVAVYSASGSMMLRTVYSQTCDINTTELPAGLYIISTPAGAVKSVKY